MGKLEHETDTKADHGGKDAQGASSGANTTATNPVKKAAAAQGDFEQQEAALKPLDPPYPKLSMGAKGDAVAHLQNRLNAADQAGLTPDGGFGGNTHKAVVKFQSTRKMTADGVVGNGTWAALEGKDPGAGAGLGGGGNAGAGKPGQDGKGAGGGGAAGGGKTEANKPKAQPWKGYPMLWRGYVGPFVKKAQVLLSASGYACEPSGTYDQGTVDLMKKFQTDNGVKSDGLCGGGTWEKLFEKGGAAGLGPAEKDPPDGRVVALIEGKYAGKGQYKPDGSGFVDGDLDALLKMYGNYMRLDIAGGPKEQKPQGGGTTGGADNSGKAVEDHPGWVQAMQMELYTSSQFGPDQKAAQKLVQAYLNAWSAQASGGLNSTVEEFNRHIGGSEENGQAGALGGSKGAMNWCQDASTRALIYGLLRKGLRFQTAGGRPTKILNELTSQVSALQKWMKQAPGVSLHNTAAWEAQIYPGDQISMVGSGPITGHAATAVYADAGKVVYVSGNAGGGLPGNGSIRTDEVKRGVPPASYASDRGKIEAKSGAKVLADTYGNTEKQMAAKAEKATSQEQRDIYAGEAARLGELKDKALNKQNEMEGKYPDIPASREDSRFKPGVHAPKTPGEVWIVAITRTGQLDANALLHMGDEAIAKQGLERCEPMETYFPDYKQVFKD